MTEPEFLERDAVLFLHDRSVREYGGLHGIRDENLFESGLARPQNRLAYGDPDDIDLHTLAAAYAFELASNHPFNDGNKRTAWSACVLFLNVNGAAVDAPVPEVLDRMVAFAAGRLTEDEFADWLRSRRRAV